MEIECPECGNVYISLSIGADICPECGATYKGETSEIGVDDFADRTDMMDIEDYEEDDEIFDGIDLDNGCDFEDDEDSDPDNIYGRL